MNSGADGGCEMLMAFIAVLLFAIAMANEGSRKVLLALVGWAFLLVAICLLAAIAIGMLFAVIMFAMSGHPYGLPVAGVYGLGALATGIFYTSEMGVSTASNALFILCAFLFWPLVLITAAIVKIREG